MCTESRPLGEGRALAGSLASRGISASVVIDAAVASFAVRSTVVFVGADALSVHGLVNKIGTHVIAMAAQAAHVPLYVVATTQRFLPPAVPLSYQEIKNPRELISEQNKNLTAINVYFDRTPLEQLTGCISEHGLLVGEALRATLASWRVTETLDLEACG
jgi:translation initiation factor eIF-2B subunit delta